MVGGLNPFIDTWITQAIFNGPNRGAVNLRDVGLLFADLDTYRAEGLRGKTPEEQASLLCLFCAQEGLPAPSIVLFSGRGLQAKWLLTSAVPAVSIFEWNQTSSRLWSSSNRSRQTARRGTYRECSAWTAPRTRKAGERVRVVHVTGGIEACPARYDFSELRALLVKEQTATAPREVLRQASARPALALPHELNLRRLNWFRLYDLRDLWTMRGGVSEGFRELTLFWELCFLVCAEPGKASDLWKEAEALGSQIDGAWFQEEIRRSTFSTLYRKAQAGLRTGSRELSTARNIPRCTLPEIRPFSRTVRIIPEEERRLRTIISHAEKYRRRIGSAGPRGCRNVQTAPGKPWEAEGVSRVTWYRRHPEIVGRAQAGAPTAAETLLGQAEWH